MSTRDPSDLPPYAYVPGGPWPHPTASPRGHSWKARREEVPPVVGDDWASSWPYLRGVALFNAGYYWEAHEAWEGLWLVHGRRGPVAGTIQALIKLAAAGVKVRERQPAGVRTHASGAARLFEAARDMAGDHILGLDLRRWAAIARDVAVSPPEDAAPAGEAVSRVFSFRIEPGTAPQEGPRTVFDDAG
ncbi:hypothetical protein OJF2_18960 [Aquisphaera giovannonii]|uniref:DUF309 domain-containing protein n=1 Tax=Aquisphaera giovannonii TaxID=406548 RepID=A0A5B9W032_9BACT|nr:DUF309 domain-containing protein [Aquisphaera giovannonii]QEH33395.1 hypothetical protein OJF2_18960 [Aquisphaera giovannonii]